MAPAQETRTPMQRKGFTLVELMIVVAIISVLAVVAGTAYRRYLDSARTTEVYSMLGEIRSREEAYRAEFSTYLSTNTTNAETPLFPLVDTGICFPAVASNKEPCQKLARPINGVTPPAGWNGNGSLSINPGRDTLQCGYVAVAGASGTPVIGTEGVKLLGNANQATMWWYAIGVCDNDGDSTKNATFVTASSTTVVTAQNEHR
jgi:prepilin-type N-terminal cleavage/methylation domain-containing protein